eukprot:15740947-Heterocapsa_arctica.AAC.1
MMDIDNDLSEQDRTTLNKGKSCQTDFNTSSTPMIRSSCQAATKLQSYSCAKYKQSVSQSVNLHYILEVKSPLTATTVQKLKIESQSL